MLAQAPRLEQILRLPDGRRLAYAEYGDPHGLPVLYFHGTPGSRLVGGPAHDLAYRHGVRVIAPDRPGFGLSDFQPGRTFLDWPRDIVALADALGLERFAIVGVSGGAPHVAACAHQLPDRVTAAAIVSGIAPLDAPGAANGLPWHRRLVFALARRAPVVSTISAWAMAAEVRRSPERALARTARSLSPSDQQLLSRPDSAEAVKQAFAEAFRSGSRGVAWEFVLLARPWGFRLEEIAVPVHLWHGEDDWSAPIAMGRYLASAIPDCQATFLPGEGHFMIAGRMEQILDALRP